MMNFKFYLIVILSVCATFLQAQNEDQYVIAMVANDTILDGNSFEYKVVIRNMKGDFTPPHFNDFDIVGGPNLMSNMQFVNGAMFREKSYTYILRARNVGQYYIEEAYLSVDGENIETQAMPIMIVDNPEQIKQEYLIGQNSKSDVFFPESLKKEQKKKIKKPLKKI